jgi:hypothetical protein
MQNHNKTIRVKLLSLALLAQLIVATGLSTMSAGGLNLGVGVSGIAFAADEGVTTVPSLSLHDSNEFLRYLKRLDTEAGRKAFDETLLGIQAEKASLQLIRDNLVSLVTDTALSHSRAIRLKKEGAMQSLFPAAPIQNPTVADLAQKIQDELRADALLLRKAELAQSLVRLLEPHPALLGLSALEPLSVAQQEILGLLEKNPTDSNLSLLARLRSDAASTDFWIIYATKGFSLLEQAKVIASQDMAFLESKTNHELIVLDLIKTLYPTESEWKAQPLSDEALELFRSIEQAGADAKTKALEADMSILDLIISDLGPTFSFDSLNRLTRRAQPIREMLLSLKADPFSSSQFEVHAKGYLALFASVPEARLATDEFMRSQWKTLNDFEKWSSLGQVPNPVDGFEKEREVALLAENAERAFKRQILNETLQPEVAVPDDTSPTDVVPADGVADQPVAETPVPSVSADSTESVPVSSDPQPAPKVAVPVGSSIEAIAPAPDTLVPVEAPVAPSDPDRSDATPVDFIDSIGRQIPVLGSVIQTLDALRNAAEAPTALTPSESLKEAAPLEPIETDVPVSGIPTTETPTTEAPAAETPTTEAPAAETPTTEAPAAETPTTEAPAAETPAAETPAAEAPVPTQILPSLEEISQGVQDFFSEALAVSSAIAQDPGILQLNSALQANAKKENLALIAKNLMDRVEASKVKPSAFNTVLANLSLNADTLDELTSFLNQTVLALGLVDDAETFSGKNGVLRFTSESCPDLAKAKAMVPVQEQDGFLALGTDRQAAQVQKDKEKGSDPDSLRIKELRALGADFCVSVSDDISTKNLIGRSDFVRKPSESVSIEHKGLGLRFENDLFRSLTLTLGQGDTSRSILLRHATGDDDSLIAPAIQAVADGVAQQAAEAMGGEIIAVETPADVTAALDEGAGNPTAYSLSSLENPAQMLVPMDVSQREAFQRVVAYEQNSHRKNVVTLFTDDAHLAAPRHLDEHTLYNFGTGLENETLVFENVILRALPDGTTEGYLFDSAAARLEVLASAPPGTILDEEQIQARLQEVIARIHSKGMVRPTFVLARPFALDKDSKPVEGLGFEITGATYNQFSLILNVDPALYPIALRTRLSLTSPGQTYYDQLLHWGEGQSNRFGNATALGDFNGDGKKDVAIGSPSAGNSRGQVALFFSRDLSGLPFGEPDVVIDGEPPLSQFGTTLWSGDLNGDGIDDLAVGSPGFEGGRGRLWVFHNALAALKMENVPLSAGTADLIITGSGSGDSFGSALAFGDLTNDGKNDVAIASPGALNGRGAVYVFENSALLKGGSLNSEEGVTKFSGEGSEASRFGTSLSVADFDRDGTLDLAVGSPGFGSSAVPDTGRVYVFFQNLTPWTNQDTLCVRNCSADKADRVLEGESSNGRFGSALSGGDLNGDGFDDLAVSANRFSLTGTTEQGRVYAFLSDCRLATADSANVLPDGSGSDGDSANSDCRLAIGDGQAATVPAREADLKITGKPGDRLGSALHLFASAKDGGLVIGDRDCDGNAGCAYIYYSPTLAHFATQDNGYTDAMASHDLRWDGESRSLFSESLGAFDFDGDGFTDFVFGAPGVHDFDGAALLFRGRFSPAYAVKPIEGITRPEIIPEEELKPVAEELVDEVPATEAKPPEFNLRIQDITQAVLETADSQFALDLTVPDMPEISCPGFQSGIASLLTQALCSWSDTTGPSKGTFRACVDTLNECVPDRESPDRSVLTGAFSNPHTYVRVQNEDLGGKGEIASFDLVHNRPPLALAGPSDGGSDRSNPTPENGRVDFSLTATDPEQNPYFLLVCRADSTPLYNESGIPTCPGFANNHYCLSDLAESGTGATCTYNLRDESTQSLIWYAFACDQAQGGGHCSQPLQGEGAEGSPAYIKYPQSFGLVTVSDTQGESVEPGDRLRFVLPRTELKDMPAGSKVTMHICTPETYSFDYVKDRCEGGRTVCSSPSTEATKGGVSCDEALDPILNPIPTTSGEKEFQVFVEHGEHSLADGPHLQKYTVADVRPTLLNTINEATIVIPVGGIGSVPFSAIFRDTNGSKDILGAKGMFFDSSVTDDNCSLDDNDCYASKSCVVSPLSDTEARADCTVDLAYNANAGNQWKAHFHVIDTQGEYTDFGVSEAGAEVPAMAAINQSDVALPYTLTAPGEVSKAVPFMLTNLGNQPVDVLISGTDLASKSGIIPAEAQRWGLFPDFDYETQGIPLSKVASVFGTAYQGCADLTLRPHDEDLGESQDQFIYWKILIPKNLKADVYKGSVSFNQSADDCQPLDPYFLKPLPAESSTTEPAAEPVVAPAEPVKPLVLSEEGNVSTESDQSVPQGE